MKNSNKNLLHDYYFIFFSKSEKTNIETKTKCVGVHRPKTKKPINSIMNNDCLMFDEKLYNNSERKEKNNIYSNQISQRIIINVAVAAIITNCCYHSCWLAILLFIVSYCYCCCCVSFYVAISVIASIEIYANNKLSNSFDAALL